MNIKITPAACRNTKEILRKLGLPAQALREVATTIANEILDGGIDDTAVLTAYVHPTRVAARRTFGRLVKKHPGSWEPVQLGYRVRGRTVWESFTPDRRAAMDWHRRHRTELWRNTVRSHGHDWWDRLSA